MDDPLILFLFCKMFGSTESTNLLQAKAGLPGRCKKEGWKVFNI